MTNKISFGEYFDDQRDRVIKAMQNKNAKQYIEWREDYEKRMLINHQVGRAMFPTCAEEKKLLEDMIDKGRL